MTRDGWRALVLEAVRRQEGGDPELLELTAAVLEEQDRAKQALRDKGYGCTGMGILLTVGEVDPVPGW